MRLVRTALLTGAAAVACVASAPASALNIVLHADSTFANQPNGAAALYAFQKAANFWNQTLNNNVTLNFNVSYAALAPNVIGSTGSNRVDTASTAVYAGLVANAQTNLDKVAVANLVPLTAAGGLSYRMPDSVTGVAGTGNGLGLETSTRGSVFDSDDTYNNRVMYTNTTENKILGLNYNVADSAFGNDVDARITFSSNFAFDFDPTDGIANGTQDFVSVAVHEMGHALGFVSGTDFYDQYGNPNGASKATGNLINWDNESVLSVWDLFRYSTNPPSNSGFDPATGKRYLQLDPNRGAAFSLDGVHFFNANNAAEAEFGNLSTGRYNGDLQQASHWKDATGFSDENGCFVSSRQIGIMDPTSGTCQLGIVTANDLAAFDAMGYNLNFDVLQNQGWTLNTADIFRMNGLAAVPEPESWAMMLMGFAGLGLTMRRARRTRVVYA